MPAGGPVRAVTSEESLGTKYIEGLIATGRLTRTTIPVGQIGNDRPIEMTDERWESVDLKVLVLSREGVDDEAIARFRREAYAAAQLYHRGIVRVQLRPPYRAAMPASDHGHRETQIPDEAGQSQP